MRIKADKNIRGKKYHHRGINTKRDQGKNALHRVRAAKHSAFLQKSGRFSESWWEMGFLLLCAFLVMLIVTKSSPLYPLNDWVDANCYLTVGKSMLHGKIPYRDLMEQKGPVVYFLHALASLISDRSFFGVFLIEVFCCFVTLRFCYQTARLYVGHSILLALPIFAALLYTTPSFSHGDSVEELALAPLSFSLFLGLRTVRTGQPLRFLEAFAIGIAGSLLFWSKYTLIGFYVGWFFVVSYCTLRSGREKGEGVENWCRLFGGLVAGALLVTLPILFYFLWHGAIVDLFRVYFYDNIFLYSRVDAATGGLLRNILTGWHQVQSQLGILPLSMILGIAASFFRFPVLEGIYFLLCTFFTHLFIFIGGRSYGYYALPMGLYGFLGILAFAALLERRFQKKKRRYPISASPIVVFIAAFSVLLLSAGMAYERTPNRYLLGQDSSEMPQFQFAQWMAQKPEATLLNYGFLDGGFYTVSGIVPNVKGFCALNLPTNEVATWQAEAVRRREVDFIVTRDEEPDFSGYTIVDRADFYFEGERHYALYRKTSEE